MVASAGTGFISGILAATWKARADRASDAFLRTKDPAARGDMRRFDSRSAAAFAVMQVSTVVLTYLLLAD
jgi:hypothetical protein